MHLDKLRHWIQSAVAFLGGLGIFAIAFLDSSVLSFPVINDLLVIQLSLKNPMRMPYYALMATLGSVAGCLFLYYLARKGGEAMFNRHAGRRAERVRGWVVRNEFLSIAIPAILPPPAPFKVFIIAAGVFRVPVRMFALTLLLVRGLRYLGVGFLAIRYGAVATHFLVEHKLEVTVVALAIVLFIYLLARLFLHPARSQA